MSALTADAKAGLIGALLAQAVTPVERSVIARTALRAGFLWRCHPCKTDHLPTTEACGCGAPRPAGLG